MSPKKKHTTFHTHQEPPRQPNNDFPASPETPQQSSEMSNGGSMLAKDLIYHNDDQKEEAEVMKAIYADDLTFIEGRKAAWEEVLAYSIRLRSMDMEDNFVNLDIEIPKNYPKVPATVKITGITVPYDINAEKIRILVEQYPHKHPHGQVAMFQLTEDINEQLRQAVSVMNQRKVLPDLQGERKNQRAAAERELEERQSKFEQQEAELATKPVPHLKAPSKPEVTASQANLQHRASKSLSFGPPSQFSSTAVSFPQTMKAHDRVTGQEFEFSQVTGNWVLLERKDKRVTIVTPVTTSTDLSANALVLKQIRLLEPIGEEKRVAKVIDDVQTLLNDTKQYRNANIVRVFGYDARRTTPSARANSNIAAYWELSFLTEHSPQGSVRDYLKISGPLSARTVRSWTKQLLDALMFFDQHAYVHPAVHVGNILVFLSSKDHVMVKLSDGYGTALRKLVTDAGLSKDAFPVVGWNPPELSLGLDRTNRTCIWDLGTVCVQMAMGLGATEEYTSPGECINTDAFSLAFEGFLWKAFQTEPDRRPKAFEFSSSEYLRSSKATLFSGRHPASQRVPYNKGPPSKSKTTSRYLDEWDQKGKLGAGGFGQVYKAVNNLDAQAYAIKKILCKNKTALDELSTEVKPLALIRHPFVVRFFGSWSEKIPQLKKTSISSKSISPAADETEAPSYSTGDPFLRSPTKESRVHFAREVGEASRQLYESADFSPGDDISSSSDETDEEDKEEEEEDGPSMLYIQMELCEHKTLKHCLRELWYDIDRNWKIFRQILEGIAHIHKQGVVHRDLKPDNIFIDTDDNIRIGDFGLSTVGPTTVKASVFPVTDTSRSVGTAGYMAPELQKRGEGGYNSKCDMFSIGVIFFEMCFPIPTAHERHEIIPSLSEPNHPPPALPSQFQEPEWAVQGRIITDLLNHNQDLRPSAEELLSSGLVPEPLEEIKMRRYLEKMKVDDPLSYSKTIGTLFDIPIEKAKDFAWSSKVSQAVVQIDIRTANYVRSELGKVFRYHGAVQDDREGAFPRYQPYADAATYLDQAGLLVQLPCDLTLPYARKLVREKIQFTKCFSFASVYRADAAGQAPSSKPEASFDLVSDTAKELSLKDAETIKVFDQIVQTLPALRARKLCIYLNHTDLLELIFDQSGVKPEQYLDVIRILSPLRRGAVTNQVWQQIHDNLRSEKLNIFETVIQNLSKYNFQGDYDYCTTKLSKLFETHGGLTRVGQILGRFKQIICYLQRFGVQCNMMICPLSNDTDLLYRGSVIFHGVDTATGTVFAVGGRYDRLIKDFQHPQPRNTTRAVGVRFDLNEIASLISTRIVKSPTSKSIQLGPMDVPSIVPTQRYALASTISAELADGGGAVDDVAMTYKEEGDLLMIILRPHAAGYNSYTIKARTVNRRDEVELQLPELVAYVKSELSSRLDAQAPKLRRTQSVHEEHNVATELSSDIVIVQAQHKGKKVNRQAIVDDSAVKRQELATTMLRESPVVAVEGVSDETLQALRGARITDHGAWKGIIQAAPPAESQYLREVQAKLKELADDGHNGAFVYNHRSKGCVFCTL